MQANIYTALFTLQFLFSGPQEVWLIVVYVIELINSEHHLQLGVTH